MKVFAGGLNRPAHRHERRGEGDSANQHQQQQRRPSEQSAGQPQLLLHAARQLAGQTCGELACELAALRRHQDDADAMVTH
jgi:hypothetical protein